MENNEITTDRQNPKLYLFTEKSLSEINTALDWARAIAEEGSLPDKYYKKTKTDGIAEDRWPVDYTKPIAGLILAVVSAGKEIGLTPFASLNMIVPIYGKMAIKGDGAKAMIFSSGLVREWKETASGDVDKDDYVYTITSTRTNGTTISQSFGVHDAKRADLWITLQKLNGNQGSLYRQSPWYRYPGRMCMYRCLGFISRDLYPDVLGQLVILEEINDYPDVSVKIIDTAGGQVAITGSDGKIQKSDELTGKAVEKVKKRQKDMGLDKNRKSLKTTAKEMEEIDQDKGKINQASSDTDEKPADTKQKTSAEQYPVREADAHPGYTEDQLLKMGPKVYDLADKINIIDEIDKLPGKKSNKKYRAAIMAFQKGQLKEYLELQNEITELASEIITPSETKPRPKPDKVIESNEKSQAEKDTSHPALGDEKEIPEQEKNQISEEHPPPPEGTNPFGIEVAEIEEGHKERDFQAARSIHLELAENGINNATYQELASRIYFSKERKIVYRDKFPDLENFLKNAKAVDIHYLLSRYDS